MKTINVKKTNKLALTLALAATLSFTSAFAGDANEMVTQNTLIDWSHKAQVALNKKLDEKLNQQLMQDHIVTRMAQATDDTDYETANLVLAGKKLGHTNLAPMSTIPVVIIRSQKPTHLAVAFDTPEPTARHKVFEDYKAHREAMPEELSAALP